MFYKIKLLSLFLVVGFALTGCANKLDPKYKELPEGIYADIQTDKGDIILELHYDKTPMTVANFVGLAEGTIENNAKELGVPYFDGLKFHRVIADFMIQGGDPKGNGTGDPGYKFADEIHPDLKHDGPGVLSMANSGPATNGSQFFITHKATPWLDGKHAVFGKVIQGQDVVDAIEKDDIMNKVVIVRIGKDAKEFKADTESFKKMQSEAKDRAEKLKEEAEKKSKEEFQNWVKENYPDAKATGTGLYYVITEEGTGEKPQNGQKVHVNYIGRFTDGRLFDTSVESVAKDEGVYNAQRQYQPFSFVLGNGQVIKGWDEGILLLNQGTKAKLIIPYWLAYGERGRQPIPPKATLIFDVEYVK